MEARSDLVNGFNFQCLAVYTGITCTVNNDAYDCGPNPC